MTVHMKSIKLNHDVCVCVLGLQFCMDDVNASLCHSVAVFGLN